MRCIDFSINKLFADVLVVQTVTSSVSAGDVVFLVVIKQGGSVCAEQLASTCLLSQ